MKLNKFDALSTEEQKQVIALCETHTYSEAVQILAQPKPDGLDFRTSPAALCRFYTAHSPLTIEAQLAHQLTKTLATYRNSNPGAALLTILAAVENHILVELSRGKSISDLDPLLKHLIRLHRLHLASEKLALKRQPTEPDFSWLNDPPTEPLAHPAPDADPAPAPNSDTNSEIFRNNPPKTPVIPQIPPKKILKPTPDFAFLNQQEANSPLSGIALFKPHAQKT